VLQLGSFFAFLLDLGNEPDIGEIYFPVPPEIIEMDDDRDRNRRKRKKKNRIGKKHEAKVLKKRKAALKSRTAFMRMFRTHPPSPACREGDGGWVC
jgi:hypothetical protein